MNAGATVGAISFFKEIASADFEKLSMHVKMY